MHVVFVAKRGTGCAKMVCWIDTQRTRIWFVSKVDTVGVFQESTVRHNDFSEQTLLLLLLST